MGGTWRIPVLIGLQSKNFMSDLKNDPTFNEAGFDREYESKWTGTREDAFFDGEYFDRCRQLQAPEYEASGRGGRNSYYILSVDVGRRGCQTVICVFRVLPQPEGPSLKTLVNIYDLNEDHFEDQCINIKKLYYKYKARKVVVDGNGLGIGLIDYLVKPQILENGDVLPDFGISNDPDGAYKKYRTKNCEYDAVYILKANPTINTEAHTITKSQIISGKVRFLIDVQDAKEKLLSTKIGQGMTPEQRADYLKPFTLTSILRDEMLNLREQTEGINIKLQRANSRVQKDKFSALEYGLYYIKIEEEDRQKRKKKFDAKDWMFMN